VLLLTVIFLYHLYFFVFVLSLYIFFNTYKFSLKSNEDLISNMRLLCIYIIRNLSIFTVTLYILIIIV